MTLTIKRFRNTSNNLVILCLAAVLVALLGNSCGTVRGFGRDVEKTGEHIEKSAR